MMRVCFVVWVMAITVVYAEVNKNGTYNGNVTRIEKNDADVEYEYYNNEEEPAPPRHLLFTVIMYAGVACIVIELLVTLYGPVIRDSPLRWHTLNYCCWNCFQIIIYANCAEESPFEKFLKNTYITGNCNKIQQMTLAIYYHLFHAPRNGVAMGQFLGKYLYEYLKILVDIILPIVTTMMSIQDFFAGLIPIAEFFATFLCLRMFRSQLLQCLSCGQNMHKPKPLTRPILPTESPIRVARASIALENGESERPSTPEIKKSAVGFFQNGVSPMPVTPDKQSSSTTTTTTS
uniref:Uncharacterized protein n=1 Tax=Panagrolaimus sp. ES5 TaxID=591445 RepID=A0AC34GYU0_9BILA